MPLLKNLLVNQKQRTGDVIPRKTPIDPWGEPYKYLSPGSNGDIDIYSFGPDGIQSEDDIGNWMLDN